MIADLPPVVINEIAWMGTSVSYNDEWIELKNNSNQEINLDGWILKATDGTPEIKLAGTVLANGFYLLERTDDNTLPGIAADQVYTGALENGGEILGLYDNAGNLIDSIDVSSGWPAGDNATKQTMEKSLSVPGTDNWQNSREPGGTPAAENSSPPVQKVAEDGPPPVSLENNNSATTTETAEIRSPQTAPPLIDYLSGVVINEILPSPTGSDEEEEWIEIFNQNNFEADLSGWKITDNTGKTEVYIFPQETTIGPHGFLVLYRPTTKITLNNQGDGLKLIQPNENITDEISYENAPRGQSYSRFKSDWAWTSAPTPGNANALPAPAPEPEERVTENGSVENLAAAAGESPQLAQGDRASVLPLAAIFIAVFSSTIIFLLKRKLTT